MGLFAHLDSAGHLIGDDVLAEDLDPEEMEAEWPGSYAVPMSEHDPATPSSTQDAVPPWRWATRPDDCDDIDGHL